MAQTLRGGFWSGYWKSLKPLSVEEPIDVWVHRPLAYILAKGLIPTPITPNMVTLGSILLGLASGVSFAVGDLRRAGLYLFLSAVFDCADGQLARMRGTSSKFGRMLDGAADLIVSIASIGGAAWVIWQKWHTPAWVGILSGGAIILTAVTGSFHTASYDHYKNVCLRLTTPGSTEGEDYQLALARYQATVVPSELTLFQRLAWELYFFYVKTQQNVIRPYDPLTGGRLGALPEYSERTAEAYRKHGEPLMRLWRGWFGFGSLVFGVAVSTALGVIDRYMLARLIGMNGFFYLYMRPAQRRASESILRDLGLPTGV